MNGGVGDTVRSHFATFGYVVLCDVVDSASLAAEVDAAFAAGLVRDFTADVAGGITGRYLPMMSQRTPVSLRLLDAFAPVAAAVLGAPVLPVRAKAVRYAGDAGWHADSDHDVASVGVAAYLEPLLADTGALRVLPGSHLRPYHDHIAAHIGTHAPSVDDLPGVALPTSPGDVIVFDEHLFHASAGGRDRRQWRVDFVADTGGDDHDERLRGYLRATYPTGWDGGYDVDMFPTYDAPWMASGRPWVDRLGELGAYRYSAEEEAFVRRLRSGSCQAPFSTS